MSTASCGSRLRDVCFFRPRSTAAARRLLLFHALLLLLSLPRFSIGQEVSARISPYGLECLGLAILVLPNRWLRTACSRDIWHLGFANETNKIHLLRAETLFFAIAGLFTDAVFACTASLCSRGRSSWLSRGCYGFRSTMVTRFHPVTILAGLASVLLAVNDLSRCRGPRLHVVGGVARRSVDGLSASERTKTCWPSTRRAK